MYTCIQGVYNVYTGVLQNVLQKRIQCVYRRNTKCIQKRIQCVYKRITKCIQSVLQCMYTLCIQQKSPFLRGFVNY